MKGSCLCATIEYEVDSLDMPIGHCHCRTCQKSHAAAFKTYVGVLREHFRWTSGRKNLSSFESSPGKLRHFCSKCGCHLVAERIAEPHIILSVATLDEDPGMKPTKRIWRTHSALWLEDGPDVVSFPEFPVPT